MMSKFYMIFPLLFISIGNLNAQFNESEFIYRVKTNYHSLQRTGLDNFSSWVTSDIFLEAINDDSKENIYPLEIIWKNSNLIYYIKRPLPQIDNKEKLNKIQQIQVDLIQELKGLLIDWLRFSAGNILDDLPETYLITTISDTVYIEYEKFEEGKNVNIKMLFGQNGLCLKIITSYAYKNETIIIYPSYDLVEDKWMCNGWVLQIYKGDDVDSGFQVSLKSRKMENYWIPERLTLQLQKKGMDDTWFMRDYKFRNVVLNKDLKIVN